MNMEYVIKKLVAEFGPKGSDEGLLVATIVKVMPNRDVPDASFNKIMQVGKALRGVGVK
jgi:hypothetical protein